MDRAYRISLIMAVTAVVGILLDVKMRHLGDWMPNVPLQLRQWEGRDLPREATVEDSSRYIARLYVNGLGEGVQLFLIAPQSVDSYRDPRGCLRGAGWEVTAEKETQVGGKRVRLMVLRHGEMRQIMAYWIQEKSGSIRPEAPVFAYSRQARAVETLRFAGQAVLTPRPVCLVRVFAQIPEGDPLGQQTRRNVLSVTQQVQAALMK